MRLTRTELKQIAGVIWSNGESEYLDGSKVLQKLQTGIKNVGPALRDSVEIEFTEAEQITINQVKTQLGLK